MSLTPTPPEPLYVVDTHALIWYLLGDKKLSPAALSIFRAAERGDTRLLIPVIVLAELHYANARNRWFPDYRAAYRAIVGAPYFRLLPLDPLHILDFDRDAVVPEMHDRIIAGVARRLGAPVITSDSAIIASSIVQTVW